MARTRTQWPSVTQPPTSVKKYLWNDVNEPGCYVITTTGDLCRIPELTHYDRPHYQMVSKGTIELVKISDDPFIPLSEARAIAANLDLPVNF